VTDPRDLLQWTDWRPLPGASRAPEIPSSPGLYRIRRVGRDDLDYIGQTSRRLGLRLGMLSGIYAEEMPYGDPHTAGPALWALRHATGCEFEVSVAPIEGSTPWRKGLEAVAIALYRQERSCSPTVEFGRVLPGYRPSSGNSARLVAAGKRFRGGPFSESHARHQPGIPPSGPLAGGPQDAHWSGHAWTRWLPLAEIVHEAAPGGSGLYRIRGAEPRTLLYVGQGKIPDRPLAHLAKAAVSEHGQGRIFAAQARWECSWIINNDWLSHQRLELENDLIAAHVLETGTIPAAQFLGESRHATD
jgi:hypothetical protein